MVESLVWHTLSAEQVETELAVDPDRGLDVQEAQQRLARYGPNELATEPPPSVWVVARGQLANPMNIMLLIVGIASFAIGQVATGFVVTALVTFNVLMGSNQELKARASVEALAQLQVPQARVRRSGRVEAVGSPQLVPGDVVLIEAGDLVPADGRIIVSATLEVQEAALTGESAPVAKDRTTLPDPDVALGDRTNLVFQNTDVTRGTATDHPFLGPAADVAGHHFRRQRRGGFISHATAVLQVLRCGHRRDRFQRRRPGSQRDAATASQAGHQNSEPPPRSFGGPSAGSSSPLPLWLC
jgi:magnesium-transporting ATPase (P-type)